MTPQFGALDGAGPVPWAFGHPGRAALLSAIATYAGLAAVIVGLAQRSALDQSGMIAQFWNLVVVLVGATIFVAALPASLGLAGACCATQRELWSGVVGGFLAILLTLAVVGVVLPVQGFV